ncbi:MAG: 50S ribosomal protein L31e [Candidatus Woesearchaeota archaeon]
MAKTEAKNTERTYNIPLRREYLKVPNWRRTKKAVTAAKQFLQKHMKTEDVRLGKHLNEELWKHGIQNPPHHIKVTVLKDEKGTARAELFGHKIELEKKVEKKSKLQEVAEKAGIKTAKETKPAEKSTETKEEKKAVEPVKEAAKPEAKEPQEPTEPVQPKPEPKTVKTPVKAED